MKKSKRVRKGIVRCLGSMICFFVVLLLMLRWKWDAASAAGPEQTGEEQSSELRHEHSGEDGACYEDGTINCGLEDGEVLGIFRIRKKETEDGYALQAWLESNNNLISSYAIRWNVSGAKESGGVSTVPVKENRTYTATISWRDGVTDAHHEETLSYTEQSSAILLRFFDGKTLLWEEEMPYGGEWPEATVLEREGYDFRGFFRNKALYYDADGHPIGFDTQFTETTLHLYAEWWARSYRLRYGDDEDGDGKPDGNAVVYYDEEMPHLTIPGSEPGYHFDGYWYNGRQLVDGNGKSKQVWQWDVDGDIFLESRWAPDTYTVYYGLDQDENGRPDQSFEVCYGEEYAAVGVPELPEGEQFEGYKLGGENVFDKWGKPVDVWHWTEEKPVLEMVISKVAVETPTPTPESDAGNEEELPTEEDEAEKPDSEETDVKPAADTKKPEEAEPMKAPEEPEKESEEEPEPEEITEEEETEEADIPEPAKKPEPETVQEVAQETESGEWEEVTEEQEPEELLEQEQLPETEEEPEPEEIWEFEEEAASEELPEPEEYSEDTDRPDSEERTLADKKQESGEEPKQEVVPESAELPENEVAPELAEVAEIVVLPEMYPNPEAEPDVAEVIRQTDTQALRREKRRNAVKKAAVVAAVTTGCLGGVAGIYAGLIYLFAMAEVDTICIDGRKKRLGRRNIRSEKGCIYSVELGRDIIEHCETDRICIRMSSVFVRFHKNRSLIVKVGEKSLNGYIKREVYLTLPSF